MYKLLLLSFFMFSLHAYANTTKESNVTKENNATSKQTNKNTKKLTDKQVKEQMAREAEYAKSQSFAQGDDYDLKAVEVNMKSLDNIPSIEPDYDFDMTDVYRDDI